MKKILAFLLILAMLLSLAACNNPEEESASTTVTSADTTTGTTEDPNLIKVIADGKSDYKIIYPLSASDKYAYFAANQLSNRIYDATGVRIFAQDDAGLASDYEIVIGKTRRENKEITFDRANYKWADNEVIFDIQGNRIFITAKDDFALAGAIGYIADTWISNYKNNVLGVNETICEQISGIAQQPSDTLSILSNNIYVGQINARKERVFNQVKYYSPDLFGIQEGNATWVSYLDESLIPLGYARVEDSKLKDTESKINSIYYNTARLKFIEGGVFWLSETPDVEFSKFEGAQYNRNACWGIFEMKSSGKRFLYLNTHLDTAGDAVRVLEAELILEFLSKYISQYPIYVSGDFNAHMDTNAYKMMLTDYSDARKSAELNLSGNAHTTSPMQSSIHTIDYIFTANNNKQKVLLFKVVDDRQFGDFALGDGEYVSDHYALYVKSKIS